MTERTDEETVELIREWLQRYGLAIIAGIILGLAGIGSYQWWKNHQLNKRYEQSAQLDALRLAIDEKKYPTAEKLYQNLQTAHDNIAELAGLVMARGYLAQNKITEAKSALENTINDGKDPLAQFAARWELANILAQEGEFGKAQEQISALQDSPYAAQSIALQGYLYEKQNQLPEAVKAYQDSLELSDSFVVRTQLEAVKAQLSLEKTTAESE